MLFDLVLEDSEQSGNRSLCFAWDCNRLTMNEKRPASRSIATGPSILFQNLVGTDAF